MIDFINDLISAFTPLIAWLIIINGFLLTISMLLTMLYKLMKRLAIQLWADFTLVGYMNYLHKKYVKEKKTVKIEMPKHEEDGGQDDN